MTREEAIAELNVLHERLLNPKDCEDGCYSWEDGWYVEAIDMAIEALSSDTVSRVDCTDFLYWLIDEVMDEDNWELNAVADGEIICRKLKKLGLLESKDGYYHDISRATEESLRNAYYDGFNTASGEAQNVLTDSVSVVRCKECRHFTHYADGCGVCTEKANILTYQNQNDFCSYGERKGGDS